MLKIIKLRTPLALVSLAFLFSFPAFGQAWVHPFDLPQRPGCPNEVMAVIEIPSGSFIKYEIDSMTGHVVVDRFQSAPMAYPANYGVITQTLAGDGDNLDVLVYSRAPIQAGAAILVRPIGILKMKDGGEQDDKVIAVPTTEIDPTYAELKSIGDLPAIVRERLEFFFKTYKTIPSGRKIVTLGGFSGANAARSEISTSVREYFKQKRLSPVPCQTGAASDLR